MTTKTQTDLTKWFFLLVSVIVLILFWKIISPYALVLLTAGIAAVIASPLEKRLRAVLRRPRLSSFFMLLIVFLVIVVPLFFIAVIMVDQAGDLVETSLEKESWVRTFTVADSPLIQALPEVVQQEIQSIDVVMLGKTAAEWIVARLGSLLSGTARLLFSTVIFFISLYYFLVDRDKIFALARELSPLKDTLDASIIQRIVKTVRSVVFGALVVAIIKALFAAIGLAIFGVPGSVLWGALVAVASQVPMVGAALVLAPSIVYLVVIGNTGAAVGLTIWSVFVVGLVDNFLAPKLVGAKTQMHELLILISILGGLQVFGPVGFIVGPTVLAAVMVVVELYKSGILENKNN